MAIVRLKFVKKKKKKKSHQLTRRVYSDLKFYRAVY